MTIQFLLPKPIVGKWSVNYLSGMKCLHVDSCIQSSRPLQSFQGQEASLWLHWNSCLFRFLQKSFFPGFALVSLLWAHQRKISLSAPAHLTLPWALTGYSCFDLAVNSWLSISQVSSSFLLFLRKAVFEVFLWCFIKRHLLEVFFHFFFF